MMRFRYNELTVVLDELYPVYNRPQTGHVICYDTICDECSIYDLCVSDLLFAYCEDSEKRELINKKLKWKKN